MTRAEFNEILNRTHSQTMKQMHQEFTGIAEEDKHDMAKFLAELVALSVEASENAVLHALEEAGILSFSD